MNLSFRGGLLRAGYAVVLVFAGQMVQAQTQTQVQTQASPVSGPVTALEYRSAFTGYQPFDEQKIMPWRDANDTVGRIGGWRAYAREAHRMPDDGAFREAGGDVMPAEDHGRHQAGQGDAR